MTRHHKIKVGISDGGEQSQSGGAGNGGGRIFHRQNFKNKESVFKAPTVGLETIFSIYEQPKDAAALFKSNEALSIYVNIIFKDGGPMATGDILSVVETGLNLPEEPDDTTGKVAFLEW